MAPSAETSLSRPVRRTARKPATQHSQAARTPALHTTRVSKRKTSQLHTPGRPVTRGSAPPPNDLVSAPEALEITASPLDFGEKSATVDSASPQNGLVPAPKVLKRKASRLDLDGDFAPSSSQNHDHGPTSAQLQLEARKIRTPARTIENSLASNRSLIATLRLSPASSAAFAAHCANSFVPNFAQASAISGSVISHATSSPLPSTHVELRNAPIATPVPNKKRKTTQTAAKSRSSLRPSVEDSRPLPWGDPQVWAETRPELCESLPYYNHWQGAVYHLGGTVRGMLLDDDLGELAWLGENALIARCGGGMDVNKQGIAYQKVNQDPNKAPFTCFKANQARKQPLQVIIGSKNKQCPSKIPHRYCVLGTFHVTDTWTEKSNGKIILKVRLEKVDLSYKSWWAAEDSASPSMPAITNVQVARKECTICHKASKQVLRHGWTCLNHACKAHWSINGVPIAAGGLSYDEAFQHELTPFQGFESPFSLIPKPKELIGAHDSTASFTRQCWKGMVCDKCGRCTQRVHWEAWRCKGCGNSHTITHEIVQPSAVMGDMSGGFEGHAISDDQVLDPRIECTIEKHGLWRIHRYQLGPGLYVAHFHSNNILNRQPGGADERFLAMQDKSFDLQRRALGSSVVQDTLSAHFSQNFGNPYKYQVAHAASTSFKDSPQPVLEAVRRLSWAGKYIVGTDGNFMPFNELLAVGYFEGGQMGYHDDGETTLGATVAAESCGSSSWMNFRLKYKYYTGCRDQAGKNYDFHQDKHPLCFKPELRDQINAMASSIGPEELSVKAKELMKANGCKASSPVALKLRLRHGDLMVMHGADMQLFFEHEVEGMEQLRFGLTCRHVKPEMLPAELRNLGDLDMDPANAYDGDLAAYTTFKNERNVDLVEAARRRRGASNATMA